MTEKPVQNDDTKANQEPGNKRFQEKVDTTKTPEEEMKDAQRRSGQVGREDATTK